MENNTNNIEVSTQKVVDWNDIKSLADWNAIDFAGGFKPDYEFGTWDNRCCWGCYAGPHVNWTEENFDRIDDMLDDESYKGSKSLLAGYYSSGPRIIRNAFYEPDVEPVAEPAVAAAEPVVAEIVANTGLEIDSNNVVETITLDPVLVVGEPTRISEAEIVELVLAAEPSPTISLEPSNDNVIYPALQISDKLELVEAQPAERKGKFVIQVNDDEGEWRDSGYHGYTKVNGLGWSSYSNKYETQPEYFDTFSEAAAAMPAFAKYERDEGGYDDEMDIELRIVEEHAAVTYKSQIDTDRSFEDLYKPEWSFASGIDAIVPACGLALAA